MILKNETKFYIPDKSRSDISKEDISKYRNEITKIKTNSAYPSQSATQSDNNRIESMEDRMLTIEQLKALKKT